MMDKKLLLKVWKLVSPGMMLSSLLTEITVKPSAEVTPLIES